MSKSRLFSGKIKKLSGGQLSVDRYEYLDVSQAEPDLGLPETDSSVLLGGTDGSRYWSQTLTNVTLDLVTITTGTVSGVLSIVNDTESTSTTTGALVISGGLAVGGNIHFGGDLYQNGTLFASGITSDSTITAVSMVLTTSTQATSTETGALVVAGGVGIGGNLYVGGEIVAEKLTIQLTTITTTSIVTDDVFTVGNDTNSVSTETGALVVAGGVGIAKDLQIAGEIFRNGISVGYGYTGSRGYDGSVGFTGSQGDTGFVGSQGDTGYTGSQGDIGYTGSAGLDGTSGTSGTDGYTGSQGDIGYTGSQGDIGYTGSAAADGTDGYTGSQGDIGYTGSQGDIGYTGSAAADGTDGYTGSQGYTGSNGESSFVFSDEPPENPTVGDRWYDTTLGFEFVWVDDGDTAQWVEITTAGNGERGYTGSAGGTVPAAITSETFVGDGSQLEFELSVTPIDKNETAINIDGVSQLRSAYSLSGSTITFSSAPSDGAIIEVTITTGYIAITGSLITRIYEGNGVQTNFQVSEGVTSSGLLVLENGILQVPEVDYIVSGNTLLFFTAPASSIIIQIRELTAFMPASSVGGATGAGGDQVFYENDQTVTTSYTITSGKSALTAGPVTIADGAVVTIPTGSRWVIL